MIRIVIGAFLLFGCCLQASAQSDSTTVEEPGRYVRHLNRVTSSRAYRMTYVAVPMIVAGVIIQGRDREYRNLRNGYAPAVRYHFDDYLQYAPAALMVGLKVGGVKGRSSWGRMLVSDAFSAAIMAIAVNSLKYTIDVERPDGSGNNSFPSGHTATAFMTATMLHKEYGGRSAWYSIAGYTMATATGVSRMINNKHWMSDVLVGAGIGILSTELGYFLADLIFKERGITYYDREIIYDRYDKPSFLGLGMGVDIIPGTYYPASDVRMRFSAGVSTNVEGAWFLSPYMGFGGTFKMTTIPVELNHEAVVERLNSIGGSVNVYGSYPITARWLFGGKVMAGYDFYQAFDTPDYSFGNRGGFACGAGTSMTFHANESLDVRFMCNYHLQPSISAQSSEHLHNLSLVTSVNIAF